MFFVVLVLLPIFPFKNVDVSNFLMTWQKNAYVADHIWKNNCTCHHINILLFKKIQLDQLNNRKQLKNIKCLEIKKKNCCK